MCDIHYLNVAIKWLPDNNNIKIYNVPKIKDTVYPFLPACRHMAIIHIPPFK